MTDIHRASFFLFNHWIDPQHSVSYPALRATLPRTGYGRRRAVLKTVVAAVVAAGAAALLWSRRAGAGIARRRRERIALQQLSRLSDHQLRDIGVSRWQLHDLAAGLTGVAGVHRQRDGAGHCRPAEPDRRAVTVAAVADAPAAPSAGRSAVTTRFDRAA
jgi:uncharacterized protein YjiS (DUF1127 family)